MKENIFSFSLQEIADWTLKENEIRNKPHASIPAFQRGLVWNPAQIEVLWDSLLRGIPVGVLSLISAEKSPQYGDSEKNGQLFWLLDGQQRANAISLGYQSFPPKDNREQKNSILWIDLLPNDEQKKRSNRKFFFYITTPAQPWGYRINDANGENHNEKLSATERRNAMNTLRESMEKDQSVIMEKPLPEKLYPITAECPIPFALFREYCENRDRAAGEQEDKLLAVIDQNKVLNSVLRDKIKKQLELHWNGISENLTALCNGLEISNHTKITALVAPDEISKSGGKVGKDDDEAQRDSDIAVYFTRLNRGGTLPSNEDLNYSILKSIVPALAKIDDLAKNRMQPARMANIAMLCYQSLHNQKWEGQIYRKTVYELAKNPEFTTFVSRKFESVLNELHVILGFDKEKNIQGLLPVLLTSIARNNPALYQVLLLLVCMERQKNVPAHFLMGFTTLITWFNNCIDFSALYKMLLDEQEKSFEQIARQWLFEMLQQEKLFLPPVPQIYSIICEAVDPSQNPTLDRVYRAWNPIGYQTGLNKIWYWNQREAREMLLYICRNYVSEEFGSYDPASVIWNEDSCPWDYDHIFPQNWIVSGSGRPRGKKYHELVDTFFNCIGNITPLHFSLNRGKSDNAPGNYFELKEKLFISRDERTNALFETKPESFIEYDETGILPFQYVSVIARRLYILYSKWYNDLRISELLNFESVSDSRKKFFKELQKQDRRFKTYYVVEDGKQLPLICENDWARPWISCGIEPISQVIQGNNSKCKCLVCITSNGKQYEIGLRRHPDDDKINSDSGCWWFDRGHVTPEINEILDILHYFAQKNNIPVTEV